MQNNEFNLLLQGYLDENKTVSNIENAISKIEKQLKGSIKIGLDLKDFESSFKEMMKEVVKSANTHKVYDSKDTKNEITKTIKDFKDLQREIDKIQSEGFKKGKVSTSFIDLGDGNKLKKVVTDYNDELKNSIKYIEHIDVATGNLVSVEKTLTNDIKNRTAEVEKLANKMGEMNEKSQTKTSKLDTKQEVIDANNINKALDEKYEYTQKISDSYSEIARVMDSIFNASDKYKGFINERELEYILTHLSEIKLDTDGMSTNFKDVNKQVKALESQLGKVETQAKTTSEAIRFAQIKQVVDKEDSIDKAHSEAIIENYKREKKAIEEQIKVQERLAVQIREVALAKREAESSIRKIAKSNDRYDSSEMDRLTKALKSINPEAKDAQLQVRELKSEIKMFDAVSQEASTTTKSFSDSMKRLVAFFGISEAIQLTERAIRSMTEAVMELDGAILEVQKVAQIPSMDKFIDQAYQAADGLKILGTEYIKGIADASRMGYSLDEAFDMSTVANEMVIVGDGINSVESAMGVLQSSLALFSKKGYEAEDVLNLINETANNTGVSFGDLSDMISRSASVGLSGSSLESIIALNTALYEVTRNAEMSASSINMINQRIQGLDIETGEQSVELISKMNDELMALTGVEIYDKVNGGLKDTASVLEEVANKWSTLDKTTQSATATLIGNNRHAKSVSALMSNWDTYYKSLDASMNSANSSQKELQAYLDSTTGKVEAMKGAFQELFVTTLSSELVGDLAEISTSLANIATECGGLLPVVSSLIGALTFFKAGKISSWMVGAVTSLKGIGTAIVGMTTATNTATVATTAFGVASKAAFGWIGLAIAGVSALVAGMNYMAGATDRAKESISEINGELKTLSSNENASLDLAKQYDELNKLSKAQKISNEQQEEFTRIQNELKEIMPEISGYYDEHGNFIATETDLVKKLNLVYDELIEKKRQYKAEKSIGLMESYKKDFDELEKNKNKYSEIAKQIQGILDGTESAIGTLYAGNSVEELEGKLLSVKNSLNDTLSSQNEIAQGMSQTLLDASYNTDAWLNSTKEQTDAMKEFISSLTTEDVTKYNESIQSGSISIEDFVKSIVSSPEVIEIMNKAIEESKNSTDGLVESIDKLSVDQLTSEMSKLSKEYDANVEKIELLNQAINSMSDGQTLTSDTLLKLLENFPSLRGEITETNGVYSISEQALLDLKNQAVATFGTMVNDQRIATDEAIANCKTRISVYQNELEQLKKLAQGQTLLSAFDSNKTAMGFDSITNKSISDKAMEEKRKQLEQEYKSRQKYLDLLNEIEIVEQDFEIATSTGNTKKGSNISGGSGGASSESKDDSVKQIKEYYDAQIKAIQDGRNKLDNEITKKQAEIDLFNLKGDNTKVAKLEDEMTILLEKRKQLTEKENVDYRGLQEKINLQMKSAKTEEQLRELKEQQIKLDELSESNSIGWYGDKQNQLEQEIELIERKAELEKQSYDDKIKQIELEQMLMNEDSNEYKLKEEEKLNLLVGLRQGYQDKIKQLKAQGLSDENDMVRKYIILWTDAEMERLNMIKAMAEKQRQVELDSISKKLETMEKQKNAIKELTDLTIAMIKKETELKKKAIQDEIDGYSKIINKKKEALQKEQDEKDYTKELSSIEKEEKKLNDKLLELSMDNSGNVNEKRLELEEELRKLLEKKEELQNDKTLNDKQDLLDKELEAFEDEKQKELDKLNDYLDKEGQIREDALDMIKRNNKAMYDKLLEYNALYGNKMESEIIDAWGSATDAADEFNNGQMDLLDVLKSITDEMTEQVRLQNEMKDKHWAEIDTGNGGSSITSGDNWHDKKDKIAKQMQSNSQKWYNVSDEEKKTLAQENEKLGQQVGAWKGSDGEWWIMVNGKRMKLYDSIGIRHTGVETGFVGNKAMSKGSSDFLKLMNGEELNILKAGELVVNTKQMDNMMRNIIPNLANGKRDSQGMKIEGGLINVVVQGDASKDTVKLLRKEAERIANYTLDKIKGSMLNLGY